MYRQTVMSRRMIGSMLFVTSLTLAGGAPLAAAGPDTPAGLVAEVDGQPITWSELESWAADQLREIDKRRHQILEASLARMVEARLLEVEAGKRAVSVEELLDDEVGAKVTPVTDDEVDAWYEQNKARVRQPKEAVFEQVRSYLGQQRTEPVRRELLSDLRQRYSVEVHLEPLRVEIEAVEGATKGPSQATVVVDEFSDFQCPACKRIGADFARLKEAYGDRVLFRFRQFPLTSIHPQAFKAAEAALCAERQGKFEQMHDALFDKQRELQVDQLKQHARGIGLDGEAFDACLDGGAFIQRVRDDMQAGRRAGVTGTPTIFVNGRPVALVRGASPYDLVSATIDDELARAAR